LGDTCNQILKKVVRATSISFDDTILGINGNKKQGCFVEILARINEQMKAMLSHHCKILVVRFDLHVENYTPDNRIMSSYIRKIRKKLIAHYGFRRLGFVWVREVERAKKQHYHIALFLDGNKAQNSRMTIAICETVAKSWDLFLYTPKNCYYRISRDDQMAYQEAYLRLSYMTKERGKGYKANRANDYSTSRIKPKAA